MPLNPIVVSLITSAIGKAQNPNPIDVMNTRANLKQVGFYDGDTDLPFTDKNLINAIKDFQQNEGLVTDGIMLPGGPTERALNRNLAGETNAFGDDPAELDLSNSVESEPLPGTTPEAPIKPRVPVVAPDTGVPLYPADVPDPDIDHGIVIDPTAGVNINPGWEI